jgi:hypothetical protein
MSRLIRVLLLAAPAAIVPQTVRAQLPWDSPQMLGPGAPAGASFVAAHYGLDPYSGLGGILILRTRAAPDGFGIRVSGARGLGDRINVGGGVDFTHALSKASAQFPLDLMFAYGAGASYGEFVEIALPIGIAGGRVYNSEKTRFAPYAVARAVVEGRVGRARPNDDVTLALAIDVGADLTLGRARSVTLRSAASFGDRQAIALGLHIGGAGRMTSAHKTPVR